MADLMWEADVGTGGEPPREAPTVRSVLGRASGRIGARDSALLLASVLGWTRQRIYVEPMRPLTRTETLRFERLVRERRRGEPVAYLTGRVAFWTLTLEVTRDVLIPRPETECLVEAVLECLARFRTDPPRGSPLPRALSVADVGTGSGAIACALATSLAPPVEVYATDLSARALSVARRNVRSLGLEDRVRFEGPGDLLTPFAKSGVEIDLLVMNPPYVRSRDRLRLSREVAREPERALDGGPDGLRVVRRLIRSVSLLGVLRPGGFLWLEVGRGQAGPVRHLLEEAGFADVEVRPDLSGIERVVGARWPVSR